MSPVGSPLSPREAMSLAIRVAEAGAGFVSPNPLVGCVILDEKSRLLATGFHAKCGGPHAEVDALQKISDPRLLEGAQVFVTLEPCAHHGRTPPCAEALARLPIAKLVFGLTDPNPLVAGRGADRLRQAGKIVEEFTELKPELEDLVEIFLCNQRHKQAFVAVKVATSLDGHLALPGGSRQWLTGVESQEYVQYLRGCYDAVLIGRETFVLDDPKLNSRHPLFASKTNAVLVLDPEGRAASGIESSQLFSVRRSEQIIWVLSEAANCSLPKGVRTIRLGSLAKGTLNLEELSKHALGLGLHSILVEGGTKTIAAFLNQGQARRWYQFFAPCWLGSEGRNLGEALEVSNFAVRPQLSSPNWKSFGPDGFVTGRMNWTSAN